MAVSENQTLSEWLAHHAVNRPEAPALIDADGEMSYGELAEAVARLASGLAQIGINKGDVVAAQLPNIRAFVIAFLAVTARGGVFQTLHMPYRSKELLGLLADSGAKAVILTHGETEGRAKDVLALRPKLPALEQVIVVGNAPDGCLSFDNLMTMPAPHVETTTVDSRDRYLLLYTSGTTAAPKGVPHVYANFLNNALAATREMQIGPDARILSLAPMSHLYGLFTLHLALASGSAAVLIPAFNPKTLLDDLTQTRASYVFAAPAHFAPFAAQKLLHQDHFAATKLLCLSGSTVPPALAKAVDDLMPGGQVIQLWGMSELQAGTFGRPDDPVEKRFSTAGAAVPNTELRTLAEDGTPCLPGQEGALQVRGPSVFAGYLNRPEETERAFDTDGWFATGDLAVIDAQGFLTITGRTKEIINRGGVKYNPVEVEEILSALPQILQCAIVPLPDPDLGERGCLCAVLAPGQTLTLDQATATLNEAGLAKYKWPEHLAILDDLPMTPTRKVMRGVLTKQVQNMKDIS